MRRSLAPARTRMGRSEAEDGKAVARTAWLRQDRGVDGAQCRPLDGPVPAGGASSRTLWKAIANGRSRSVFNFPKPETLARIVEDFQAGSGPGALVLSRSEPWSVAGVAVQGVSALACAGAWWPWSS